jgi:hypothetical protein
MANGLAAGAATTPTTRAWASRCVRPAMTPQAQVLWNALAPGLWRRTIIAVQRSLARHVGVGEAGLRRLVRVSYAKVAEFQKRGAVHFHAVIRLDPATACRCPDCLAPPEPFTAGLPECSAAVGIGVGGPGAGPVQRARARRVGGRYRARGLDR